MKTRTLIISLISLVILICLCFFIKGRYFSKPEKAEITQFLNDFKNELKDEHIDSALGYFEADKNNKKVILLVKILAGKTGMNGKTAPIFNISLNADDNKVVFSNSTTTVAEVPVSFSHADMSTKQSVITFTIHKIGEHKFKIAAVKTDVFSKDYLVYSITVRSKTVPEDGIYSPITLAAFKNADKLKSRYDSVLWFQHLNNRTWFYVIKGTLNKEFYWLSEQHKEDYKPTYKMGLVNPDLKEVIPAEYDLIHNINGTIQGLIEVEKDGKKGFYNPDGKLVLPVNYDQIFPLRAGDNLALLRNGDDYFYLKNDSTVSDKIQDFKIAEVLPMIKTYGDSYTLSDESSKSIMEYNDREDFTSLVIAPSYLVDWGILEQFVILENPLRKPGADNGDIEASGSIEIKYGGAKKDEGNWFESAFYSLYNDYLGGRSGLYVSKHVLMVDKKQNRILAFNAPAYEGPGDGGSALSGKCNENGLHAIDDSLFEFRTTVQLDQNTLTDTIDEAPYYHYLHIKNGKLVALPNERAFGCTKYVKLNDSYLQGCYVVNGIAIDHVTPAILQYMKNEIYASYLYKFKNDAWNNVFIDRFANPDNKQNASVDDSLTVIDKYNINWLNQKLQGQKSNTLAAQ